jgi:hypothetical protein
LARGQIWIAAVFAVACAAPKVSPPAVPATLQGGEVALLNPTHEQIIYGRMASVAIRQSRFLTSQKIVGIYQSNDPKAPLYPIIKKIFEENAYREIHQGQAKVACTVPTRPGLRGGSSSQQRTCGLDVVDVLLQVTSVQIAGDSGYVGGYMTEVMRGEDRPRSRAFCFMAFRQSNVWVDVRNSLVKEPRDCASDRKH